MKRPVRPVALVVLTACMLYPGVTFLFQGLYPFINGEAFIPVGHLGPWEQMAERLGLPVMLPLALKTLIGLAWAAGVPGLWAGDGRAYPLVLLAALGSALYPGGPMVMGLIGLVCLLAFRETERHLPA
jgi:hypothetical protein